MLCVVGDDNVVEYEVARHDARWVPWLWLVALALSGAAIAGQWFAQHRVRIDSIVLAVLAIAVLVYLTSGARRPRRLVADNDAIRRPRPLHDLSWGDVDHVQATTRWSDTVRVVMTDGSVKPTGFPSEYAERLAAVGNKPLR